MNKCRAPKIPPLFVNNLFILNCREKARYFKAFFNNNSVLPTITFLTDKRINYVTIENDEIISLIRKNKP